MFHAGACRVFWTVFSTHRHPANTNPAHPVSVPIHPSDKSSAVETDISFTSQMQQDTRYMHTYAVYSCVWRLGCFPRAWRRGSSHFHVASLHLQSSMKLLFVRFTLFSFLSKRSGRRIPPAERSALYIHTGRGATARPREPNGARESQLFLGML